MKVNVWQVGYTTQRDYVLRKNAQYRNMGYVEVPDDLKNWEEEVWHLLNWSCWNYNENGHVIKPANVHSSLDHCNSDIILQIDGSYTYKYVNFIGFGEAHYFADAFKEVKRHSLWPFDDVPFKSGCTIVRNGKAYWQSIEDDRADKENWIEITW